MRFGFFVMAVVVAPLLARGEEEPRHWPGWRGPDGNGVSHESGFPERITAGAESWRVPVPGRGHSSPVVWGDRLFLTASIPGEEIPGREPPVHIRDGEVYLHPGSEAGNRHHTLLGLAYDAETGTELWRRVLHDGPVYDNRYRTETYASLTAVTDGERVYFWFGSQGLFALTLGGEPVWRRDLGDFGDWGLGHGISPVLHGDLLILVCDDGGGETSMIFGVDRRTGEVAWQTPRRVRKSWGTPTLVPVGDRVQLVVASYDRIAAYDPATGIEIWGGAGFDSGVVHTPVHLPAGDDRLVFVSTGYPDKEMRALRLTADGATPKTEWAYRRGTGYLPSGLVYGEVLFVVSDGGVVTGLDPLTGGAFFQGRPPHPGRYHASPVGYEGKVLIASLEGDITIFRAAPEFEILETGSLDEAVWASPALAGGALYLRTVSHLYAWSSE